MTATQESPTPGQTLIGALVGMIEHHFAQRIIDATWRLNRATPPEPQTVPATGTEQSQLPISLFCKFTPETEETIHLTAKHSLLTQLGAA